MDFPLLRPTIFTGIIDTEEAGTLVFSGVPAFFVTIVLLVQCSVKQKFIVVQPMKTSL